MIRRNHYEFISIGDITTDAFIFLKDATVNCDINHEKCVICMRFGDKIPYKDVVVVPAVGNSTNAAVSAARLGLKSAVYANIGDDQNGKDCIKTLASEGIATNFIVTHRGKKTNYHYVLSFNGERTILIKHQEYDYALPKLNEPKWIYLSSLGENSLQFHSEIEKFLNDNPDIKLAFQPGTFQMKFGASKLAGIYKRSEIIFCNKQEAQRILETNEEDMKVLLRMMVGLGPKTAVITDGVSGAYFYDGDRMLSMRIYPDPKPPVDRTGAGDAFSSTFVAALALGLDAEVALRWAPINSMSVVQYVGAREGLLSRDEIEKYLKSAPGDYEPKKIN